jgi:hypothetical protein
MLRNLLVHGMIASAPYYLLALPDVFYLWKDLDPSRLNLHDLPEKEFEPDFKVATTRALAPYIDWPSFSPDDISEPGLELLVSSWLTDLVNDSALSREAASPDLRWLFDSGLYDAIKGGHVATEVAV